MWRWRWWWRMRRWRGGGSAMMCCRLSYTTNPTAWNKAGQGPGSIGSPAQINIGPCRCVEFGVGVVMDDGLDEEEVEWVERSKCGCVRCRWG
ncbi:hypothetical protein B0H14DRAFT_2882754 [Mycena olivaceomarginata]|nr:hypothetical protein B0H14DRAFT_2882754 [Mycena olivaceomarginata]